LTPQNDENSEAAAHSLYHVIKSAATEGLEKKKEKRERERKRKKEINTNKQTNPKQNKIDLELCSWPGNERREKTNPPADSIIYHIAADPIFRTLMEIVSKAPGKTNKNTH